MAVGETVGIIEGEDNVESLVNRTVGRAVEGDDKVSKGREQIMELTLGKEVDTRVETDKEEV